MGKQKYRTLVDSGAELALMRRSVYNNLSNKPKLFKKNICLQSVSGQALKIDGCVDLTFLVKGLTLTHTFVVVKDMNRNLILGRDWLKQNGVRMYFDLGLLRIDKTYVQLQEDIHISSVVRLSNKLVLKPLTSYAVDCRLQKNLGLDKEVLCELSEAEKGFISTEPGVKLVGSVSKSKNRRLSIMIMNTTQKTIKLRRGCVVAVATPVSEHCCVSLNREIATNDQEFDLSELKCADEYRRQVSKLIQRNRDLFATSFKDLTGTDTVQMTIDTGDHPPIKCNPYRCPLSDRQRVEDAVDEMLKAKIIEKSRSPWAFPIVLVRKPDGSTRFCCDFRKLNRITKKISYPLPVIEDILSLLSRGKIYSTLDLFSGYWNVKLDPKTKEKATFTCHMGTYTFGCLSFGLVNAGALFQELMNTVLEGLPFAFPYIDDIAIVSETPEQHLEHIKLVFERLREHKLKLKLKKCNFFREEIKYLGFLVNKNGIAPDPEKVKAIREISPPTTVKQVRSFFGCVGWYRKLIPNFSEVAEPLIVLTRKYQKFRWGEAEELAFKDLKRRLTVIPFLAFPDPSKPYKLYTDSSNV